MPEPERYRAFLSYSHTDSAIAARLHKRWENFRIDKDLVGIDTPVGPVPASLRPIFFDRGDFGVATTLSAATREALANADALIVLASPASGKSENVDTEIRLFRVLHPTANIAPLILRGSAAEAFPPSLSTDTLAADWIKDGHDRAVAKIVAALLGLPPDLIIRRQRRQDRVRRLWQGLAAVVLAAALSGAGYWKLVSDRQETTIAASHKTIAEIEAIVRQYAPIGSAQAAPLTEALKSIVAGAATNPKYAQALLLLQQGKAAEAEPLLREAAREMEAQAKQGNKQAAEAYRNLGAIAGLRDPKTALVAYAKAVELDPDNANALGWAAHFEFASGDLTSAERHYKRLLGLPATLQAADDGYVAYAGLGDIAQARGNLPDALRSYRDALAIAERLAKADTGNAGWQRDLSVSFDKIGNVLVAQGNLPDALRSYRDGLTIAERLAKADSGNAEWQRDLSVSFNNIGDVLVAQGNLPDALRSYRDALTIRERLAKADSGNAGWQRDLSVSFNKIGDVLVAQGMCGRPLGCKR